jgi:putative hydrolase of the HAD superfamily
VREQLNDIRGIVFDLDGTLYESQKFAATIQEAAAIYIADITKSEKVAAFQLITETRRRLAEERDEIPTLSAVCSELGGTIQELHAFFQTHLHPEQYLSKDYRVISLLESIKTQFPLYLYTNNNRALTIRILVLLGLGGVFRKIYAIDDTWIAKPDSFMLNMILDETGLQPEEALFVGDRYDVDLRLPEQRGCPVYLSQSIEQLLLLGDFLKI